MRISYVHVITILLIRNFCVSQFHQDDYDIEQDRMELTEFNKTAARNIMVKVFKYNDTLRQKAINFSIYLVPGAHRNILLTITFYKNVQNVYRIFPIPNITIDLCEQYTNIGGSNPFGVKGAIACSNFKGCPLAKGFYLVNTWILEQDKFPPHLPGGDYKIRIHAVVDDNIFVLVIEWYGTIIKKRKHKH